MRNVPTFSALKAFESAAKLGSFKSAALELNLSTSAISHQIRSLEQTLGEALFSRQGNGVLLTEKGEQYLIAVRSAFDLLEAGAQILQDKERNGSLCISLLSSLSTLWLIPRLDSFHHLYPDTNIELIDSSELVDFGTSAADAAIRYDFDEEGRWPDVVAYPLIEEYVVPVCSPEYLKQYPGIETLEWNNAHTALVNKRHRDEWESWFHFQDKVFGKSADPTCTILDTSNMTLMAAVNNLGVAMGRTPFVDEYLASGKLVRFHTGVQPRGTRHYLVCSPKVVETTRFIEFRDWLVSQAESCNQNYKEYV